MIIIGAGRVGQALEARAAMRGLSCLLVTRTEGWEQIDPEGSGPIFVATRNDDLNEVVDRIAPSRREDLILTQNGMLRPWIAGRELHGVTRGLLFFAVSARGEDLSPGGLSPFTGPRASAVVSWLQRLDVPAQAVDDDAFRATELEKLIWNCAFGLMCQRHSASVGTVVTQHREQLKILVDEMNRVGGAALGTDHELQPLFERLCAYSLSIPAYRGAVKEYPWRNGWFVELCSDDPSMMPVHQRLLAVVETAS
ncbi:MAG TPA: hypothetical protein DCQ06_07640 [Myxococcales bacterium]|nr:hypothetical protein [Myxococcales bacterium]HAN31455.1 hypothetical protein [Myxococcales bacterium]